MKSVLTTHMVVTLATMRYPCKGSHTTSHLHPRSRQCPSSWFTNIPHRKAQLTCTATQFVAWTSSPRVTSLPIKARATSGHERHTLWAGAVPFTVLAPDVSRFPALTHLSCCRLRHDNAKAYRGKAFALFSVFLLNIVHIPQQYSVSHGVWVHWLRLMPLILISAVVYLSLYTRRRRCITRSRRIG